MKRNRKRVFHVHFGAGQYWTGACGAVNHLSKRLESVTCEKCRRSSAFKEALASATTETRGGLES